jgi:hypothetical protein
VVQAAVVELRRSAQRFGDETVSDFKLFEDGQVQLHRLLAEGFFESAQLIQSVLAAAFLFGGRADWERRDEAMRIWGRSGQTNPADAEVFFEAIQLEEIGEFEGADVAAGVADLLLEVADDLGQVGQGEAGAVELKPEPLPVKAQREVLTGETAIGLMELLDLRGPRWS